MFHVLNTFSPMFPMVCPFKIILSFLIFVPSSFKPISLLLDSVLFSSGSVASSLHLSELLVISQLSWILRALAFCLLIKGAVILKDFLFPALKQTHFLLF